MADTWGALAQSAPAATTLTDAYTCPVGRRATAEIIICNRGIATSVRVSHAIAGAADANSQYVLYDYALGANDAISTRNITLGETDKLRVYSASGGVTFTVNGIEETP